MLQAKVALFFSNLLNFQTNNNNNEINTDTSGRNNEANKTTEQTAANAINVPSNIFDVW